MKKKQKKGRTELRGNIIITDHKERLVLHCSQWSPINYSSFIRAAFLKLYCLGNATEPVSKEMWTYGGVWTKKHGVRMVTFPGKTEVGNTPLYASSEFVIFNGESDWQPPRKSKNLNVARNSLHHFKKFSSYASFNDIIAAWKLQKGHFHTKRFFVGSEVNEDDDLGNAPADCRLAVDIVSRPAIKHVATNNAVTKMPRTVDIIGKESAKDIWHDHQDF